MSCENCEESAYVIDKLAKLLAEIAIIVNGPEPPLTRWSYHDLPAKVRALKQAPPAAVVQPEYPSMFEFFVVMQKRSSGEVFPDLHKTNGQIYFTEEDAARALDADPELKPYRHVVRLLAQVTPPAALAVPDWRVVAADERGWLLAVYERIIGNAHPEEDSRVEIAYAIARHLGLDCPCAHERNTQAQQPAALAVDTMSDLQRDIALVQATIASGAESTAPFEAWRRILARLTPDQERVALPDGMVMVQRADLAALEATDFGRCGWSGRADLAALRLRDGLLAAARKGEP